MFYRNIHDITVDDLNSLIADQVEEGKTIDYKLELPTNGYDSKKEFLADVSSFANAQGGFLFFGIREENRIPVELVGLPDTTIDDDIQKLENMLRANSIVMIPVPQASSSNSHSSESNSDE